MIHSSEDINFLFLHKILPRHATNVVEFKLMCRSTRKVLSKRQVNLSKRQELRNKCLSYDTSVTKLLNYS
jgi:hypothetical protein